MKIALFNPPSPFLLDDLVFPPLGVLQVAAALENAGHDVCVTDLGGKSNYKEATRDVAKLKFDAYGITTTTQQFPMAIDIYNVIREEDPGKKIIVGGPHPTVMPSSCSMFDVIVLGDGEDAVLEALQTDAPKLIDRASTVVKGTLKYILPARHLIDLNAYKYTLYGIKGTSVLTEAGCPFNCSFCCGRSTNFYRRVRTRNPDEFVEELVHLRERYGIGAAMDFSDEINLLTEPLLTLCKKIKPLKMKFRAFVKANIFDDRQAEAMAEAGFVELNTGVESGDDRILGVIDKKTTRVINKNFVDLCKKYGMRSKAFMSLSQAGETYESAMNSQEWLLWAKPDDFDITIVSVYPATPYWDNREAVGINEQGQRICRYKKKSKIAQEDGATLFFEEVDYTKEFAWYKGRPGEYISHTWTPDLSKGDLTKLRDSIEDRVRKELGIPYPKRYSGDFLHEGNMLTGSSMYDSSMG